MYRKYFSMKLSNIVNWNEMEIITGILFTEERNSKLSVQKFYIFCFSNLLEQLESFLLLIFSSRTSIIARHNDKL